MPKQLPFLNAIAGLLKPGEGTPEETLEHILASLPGSCTVVRRVLLPGAREPIDYVVLTPAGIHTLVLDGAEGTVTVGGGGLLLLNGRVWDDDLLSRARAETTALREYLAQVTGGEAYAVEPVIVFSRAVVKADAKAKGGVTVVGVKALKHELTKEGARMPAEKREKIAGALVFRQR